MGAARFAFAQLASDPEALKLEVDRIQYEREIKKIREEHAAELAALRLQLTSHLAAAHRQLTASRSEVEHLKSVNCDLQCRLQEQDAAMKNLKAVNADLEQQLRAFGNISKFLAEVARGEMRGER